MRILFQASFGQTAIKLVEEVKKGKEEDKKPESKLDIIKTAWLRYTLKKWHRVPMNENEAALIIQQAFKDYLRRKRSGGMFEYTNDIRLLFTDSKNDFFKLNM